MRAFDAVPFEELVVVDYGDAPTDIFSTERTVHERRA